MYGLFYEEWNMMTVRKRFEALKMQHIEKALGVRHECKFK